MADEHGIMEGDEVDGVTSLRFLTAAVHGGQGKQRLVVEHGVTLGSW